MGENQVEENKLEKEGKILFLKKFLHALKKGWIIILMLSIIGALTGLVIANRTYKNKFEENSYVILNFRYTDKANLESFDYKTIISKANIERCKEIYRSLETGSFVSTYKYVEIKDSDISIIKNKDSYTIKANPDCFNVSKDGRTNEFNDSAAKGFLKHLTLLPFISDEEIKAHSEKEEKSGHQVFEIFDNEFYKANSLTDSGKIIVEYSSPSAHKLNLANRFTHYLIWISSFTIGLFILSIILLIVLSTKIDKIVVRDYDNINIYRTPFHLSFFNNSLKSFKDIKSLVIMAILLSMVMISKFIPIPSGFGELGLGFGFLFLAIACMLFGPYPSLLIGLLSDVIGYLIKPDGMFFIGYTLQSMVACFAYALLLHKTYVTYTRCFIARVIVNLLCNVIIGSLSWAFISKFNYDQTITYMLTISLPKNLLYLLPQSLLLFIVLKAILKPISAFNMTDERIAKTVSLF